MSRVTRCPSRAIVVLEVIQVVPLEMDCLLVAAVVEVEAKVEDSHRLASGALEANGLLSDLLSKSKRNPFDRFHWKCWNLQCSAVSSRPLRRAVASVL